MPVVTVTYSLAEWTAVSAVLGHALDQSHDTIEGDYLQFLVDGSNETFEPTLERDRELGETLLAVLTRKQPVNHAAVRTLADTLVALPPADGGENEYLSVVEALRPFLTDTTYKSVCQSLELCWVHVCDERICADDQNQTCPIGRAAKERNQT